MYKLDLEKAEEPEIKLPTSAGSQKKEGNCRRISTSASLTTLKPLTVWIITNWKILKEMEIPDHFTCLLRNLYAGQGATVRTGHGTMDWFKLGKEYVKAVYCRPAYLIYMQSISCKMLGLDESQGGIKIARRNIHNLRYADDTTLMTESKEELKSLLMKVKEESEKAGLKLSIQKKKILAPSPITSWQIAGGKVDMVKDFIFVGSKITAMKLKDSCSLEEKL